MRVVVYAYVLKDHDVPHIQRLFDALHEEGISVYVYGPYLDLMRDKIKFQKPVGEFDGYIDFTLKKFDFVIALGGDGTILSAITHVRESGVPILGINLGRLGFLASIEKKRIRDAVQLLAKGRYSVEERGLLYLESNMPLFGDTRFALNDFTILKRDTSSMITIHTYINGSYLNTYWADGIIVATPTGSTGYSLSCGGPIIFPNSGNFVITPVATHNLNVRPVVISDDSIISFDVEGRAENFLCTLDSRFETITSAHQLAVRKNDFSINLVQLHDYGFMDTMRDKLAWGQDSRN
ncbi:MAG: NAD kinase [Haliscomenobacter sp.]|jgi:NAD+ kinase|uniref:NAD kinase n=1 Tax=Haliscomenobacter sp. TaxID=2717303 RepID=UPI0029A7F580|nr:NAD kinase [Haliscomenobacter sp.]MDX2066791.1 NAD kinase [Haliscomenobacter sp.]